jgi:hypothetical protein
MTSPGSADPHDESAAQRADRNLGELLQELRVAGLGVQVGFLLSLPFTSRFTRLSGGQRDLYLACLVRAASAVAAAGLITALIACMFGLLWFAFPLTRR